MRFADPSGVTLRPRYRNLAARRPISLRITGIGEALAAEEAPANAHLLHRREEFAPWSSRYTGRQLRHHDGVGGMQGLDQLEELPGAWFATERGQAQRVA